MNSEFSIDLDDNNPYVELILECSNNSINSIGICPAKRFLICGSADCNIYLYDLHKGTKPFNFSNHKQEITSLAIHPSGTFLASTSLDCTIRFTRINSQGQMFSNSKIILTYNPINQIVFDDTGDLFAIATYDNILIYDTETRKCKCELPNEGFANNVLFVNGEEYKYLASATFNSITIWDYYKSRYLFDFNDHNDKIYKIINLNSEYTIASCSHDGSIHIYDLMKNRKFRSFSHDNPVTDISCQPSGNYLLASLIDGSILIYDLAVSNLIWTLYAHEGKVNTLCWSRFGDYFYSGGEDGKVIIWAGIRVDEFVEVNQEVSVYPVILNESNYNKGLDVSRLSSDSKINPNVNQVSVVTPTKIDVNYNYPEFINMEESKNQVEKEWSYLNYNFYKNNSNLYIKKNQMESKLIDSVNQVKSKLDLLIYNMDRLNCRIDKIENK